MTQVVMTLALTRDDRMRQTLSIWRFGNRQTRVTWRALWLGIAVASILSWFTSAAQSQTTGPPTTGGLEPLLPVVPESTPRTLEGSGPGEHLETLSPPEPVASFIDSLKGNDAAMEVVLGQGRLLTLKRDLATDRGTGFIAVGDPSIVEFEILPNPRMIRLIGLRPGVTDMSLTASDGDTYALEVHVVYDLPLLRAQLRQLFPSARLRLAQLREHIVVEGQARSPAQVTQIIQAVEQTLSSVRSSDGASGPQDSTADLDMPQPSESLPPGASGADFQGALSAPGTSTAMGAGGPSSVGANGQGPQVINLIQVPGVQQVMLKVRIAELNRRAMREVGADILAIDPDTGNIVGTQIGGAIVQAAAASGFGGLVGSAASELGSSNTAFGIFPSDDFAVFLRLLRQNSLVRVLAEPNLMAMSGHRANFLAGGEYPIPVAQQGTDANTIEFREFGVRLDFMPIVLDDERIRLSVTPEVSTIDDSLGTTLVLGGDPVPGLNTRRAHTTVELRQGQTLAIAGLLQVTLDGQTNRIAGLGDLPIIGPLFSNTGHQREEKELLVLVTPYLVQPMEAHQVPPSPGDFVEDPTDMELYFGNRIEGRTGRGHRSTTQYGFPSIRQVIDLQRQCIHGPVGFSE